jgi:hypothetical protein
VLQVVQPEQGQSGVAVADRNAGGLSSEDAESGIASPIFWSSTEQHLATCILSVNAVFLHDKRLTTGDLAQHASLSHKSA